MPKNFIQCRRRRQHKQLHSIAPYNNIQGRTVECLFRAYLLLSLWTPPTSSVDVMENGLNEGVFYVRSADVALPYNIQYNIVVRETMTRRKKRLVSTKMIWDYSMMLYYCSGAALLRLAAGLVVAAAATVVAAAAALLSACS